MSKIIQFGENVDGFEVPVLNEREIRASAGIFFLFAYTVLMLIIFKGNYTPAKFFVYIFLSDFMIRVLINPKFSPSLIIGRLIVKNQQAEYVGAPQKKFAWMIGIILGSLMFFFLIILNTFSPVTGIICLICLIFLFFESVFGICLGCIFFKLLNKEQAKYCSGKICEVQEKEAIQEVSKSQLLITLAFIIYIGFSIYLLKDTFKVKPEFLFNQFAEKKEATIQKPN